MFNRFTITALPSSIELKFKIKVPDTYQPNFNAAPDQILPIVLNSNPKEAVSAQWGLIPGLSKHKELSPKIYTKHINSIKSSEIWLKVLRERRCIVLADGFYIWKFVSKKSMIPYRVVAKTGNMICFCGIWESEDLNNPLNNKISFSIVTRETYKPVHELSEEMPVVLTPQKESSWLDPSLSMEKIIHEIELEDWALLKYYPVSPKIRDININTPSLIKLSPPSDQHGNLSLFG